MLIIYEIIVAIIGWIGGFASGYLWRKCKEIDEKEAKR